MIVGGEGERERVDAARESEGCWPTVTCYCWWCWYPVGAEKDGGGCRCDFIFLSFVFSTNFPCVCVCCFCVVYPNFISIISCSPPFFLVHGVISVFIDRVGNPSTAHCVQRWVAFSPEHAVAYLHFSGD